MKMRRFQVAKRYSPKFKFHLVMELLRGKQSAAQLAKAYGVHPNTVHNWKQQLMENGPEIYARDRALAEYERQIAKLERMLGKRS
jgi:transposase-like protein